MSQGLTPIWRMAEAGNAGAGRLVAHLLTGGAALFALGALAGAIMQEAAAAVVFAWGTVLLLVVGMAVRVIVTRRKLRAARSGLLILTGLYILGPAVLAVPFHILAPTVDPASAYFEAASALTTTGASILRDVTLVPKTLIFWRALIAGAGGFICFVAALAIMAPLSIGGFEVDHGIERTTGADRDGPAMSGDRAPFERGVEQRVFGAIRLLGVPYLAFLTLVTLGLAALGLPPFEAICLSLSAISTTGFAPVNGGLASYDSFLIEAVLIAAMVLAALGVATHGKAIGGRPSVYRHDPELRYLAICVAVVVAVIFLRHWIGAIETRSTDEISAAIESLWGAFFMAISFVTTTGLHSSAWQEASAWSGLETPGVMLLGLAIIGGGAASTAGGVKLIRAALLAKHSLNELSRLSHPASVRLIHSGGRVVGQRALRIVFVFVMLYILALGATALALAACGVYLVDALAASIAVVSNTGPVLPLIQGAAGGFADMPPVAKILLCIGMVVGRLETLAVVAVLSPSGWRT